MNQGSDTPPYRLSPADAAAVDRLIESAFAEQAKADPRQDRIAALFSLLDLPTAPATHDAAALVDVTMARVLRQGRAGDEEVRLSPDDEAALEAFIASGYNAARAPASLRGRADACARLGRLITQTPTGFDGGALLLERTMERIPLRRRPAERAWSGGGGLRLADLVSAAAVLLIGASVVWPVMTAWRGHQQRAACGANFASVASAMGMYADDNRGSLPIAAASLAGPAWWNVGGGPGQSNSANLFHLPKHDYVKLASLACPGNAGAYCGPCPKEASDWRCIDEVSYSYQIMFGSQRPGWSAASPASLVILADGSPAVRRSLGNKPWHPLQNSGNHGGRGQWALRNDGSAVWLTTPIHGEGPQADNIWLPGLYEVALRKIDDQVSQGVTRGEITIRGDELPASDRDAFLGP